ncbi:glycosyltransferase, partial [Helicobacter pullorum]
IKSFKQLNTPNIHLFIIGQGELENTLNTQIKDANLEDTITLLGATTNPYAPLSCANFFLFASNHEGFPNVLVESLSLRIPIITTDCAPNMILECHQSLENFKIGKCGITTPLNNAQIMAEAIEWALANPNYFSKENLLHQAQKFDISHQLPLYQKWLELP